ncbi:MAG: FecR domain-containing protein [Verrucomicrobiota bacterium]
MKSYSYWTRPVFGRLLVCAIFSLFMFSVKPAPAAEGKAICRAVRGTVEFLRATSPVWQPVRSGLILNATDTIRTGANSSADFFLSNNGPVIRVPENSVLRITTLRYENVGQEVVIETRLHLLRGRLLGNVKKLAPASKYEVLIPHGLVAIRGTQYDIGADGEVTVISGTALVLSNSSLISVGPGQTASLRPSSPKLDPWINAPFETVPERIPETPRARKIFAD